MVLQVHPVHELMVWVAHAVASLHQMVPVYPLAVHIPQLHPLWERHLPQQGRLWFVLVFFCVRCLMPPSDDGGGEQWCPHAQVRQHTQEQ